MSVKETIIELKDTVELMLDLAYSSLLFDERYFGEEVMELEDRVDDLVRQAGALLLRAARGAVEADQLAGYLRVLTTADKIAEAAADIAEIRLTGIPLPAHFLKTLNLLEETLVSAPISQGSQACGRRVEELEAVSKMTVIAVRHEGHWVVNPPPDLQLVEGDKVIARGPFDALEDFELYVLGEHTVFPPIEELQEPEELRAIRELVVTMKNYSELAVDLAYSSLIFGGEEVADEVMVLEARLDGLRRELEERVLSYARRAEDIAPLVGVLRIAWSCERISDAAQELAELALSGAPLRELMAEVVEESEEQLMRIEAAPGLQGLGKTLAELDLEAATGVQIVAVRKADTDRWIYHPKGDVVIEPGDVLIIKGSPENREWLVHRLGLAEREVIEKGG
jgi:uncharacterized protein with PhoU and TrkA domain